MMTGVRVLFFLTFFIIISNMLQEHVYAQLPGISVNLPTGDDPTQVATTLQLLFLVTIIALAPSILIMVTCFTRIIIALHFMRSALGTQQMPPNQVLMGLALFLTLFLMNPSLTTINENAIKPYSEGKLSLEEAVTVGMEPLRGFMFAQVADKDVYLFLDLAGEEFTTKEAVSNRVLIPAFILGELSKGFIFGFMIYLPFIVIDMVVASTLMAMGMMMLPPAMISLPFKLLLFVMADGWSLVIENLMRTFR